MVITVAGISFASNDLTSPTCCLLGCYEYTFSTINDFNLCVHFFKMRRPDTPWKLHRTVDSYWHWLDDPWVRALAQNNPERHFYNRVQGEGVEIVLDRIHLRIAPRCCLNKKWSESAATFVLVSGSLQDFLSRACYPYRIRIDWYVLFLKGALCGCCCLPPTHHGLLRVFFRRNTVVSTVLPGCFSFSHSLGMLHLLPRAWYLRVT